MCDTLVVVGPDRVLFAKNSDRDPNEAQVLDWQPKAAGRHAVLLSRPFWMEGAEMGANEHGVVIGNEAVFTTAPIDPDGWTGMAMLRHALETAVTRHEALEVLVRLVETHGQGGRAGLEDPHFRYHNSFLVADRTGAWVLETAGRAWATEEVTAGVRAISNGLTIEGFARTHAKALHERVAACRSRRTRTSTLAAAATGPGDLFAVLRDHGDADEPRYSLVNGAMSAPCMHGGGFVAASQTTASWVSELTAEGAQHWATATSGPCTGLFKPVALETPLALGAPTERADDSLWWRHEHLHRQVMRDPGPRLARYREERDAVEARWLASPPDSEAAFAEADALLTKWTADQPAGPDQRPWFVRRYWARRDAWAAIS